MGACVAAMTIIGGAIAYYFLQHASLLVRQHLLEPCAVGGRHTFFIGGDFGRQLAYISHGCIGVGIGMIERHGERLVDWSSEKRGWSGG